MRGRRTGTSTTREEIIAATTLIVEEEGIDRATIRRIATVARVDPALIYRHFKDKDGLFDAVYERLFTAVPAYEGALNDGREIVAFAYDLWESPARRAIGVSAVRAALSSGPAAKAVREVITRSVLKRVRPNVRLDHQDLRLALIGSQIIGVMLIRHRIRLPGLVKASREEVVRTVGAVVEHYMHGELGIE